jgi:hypothetical protein
VAVQVLMSGVDLTIGHLMDVREFCCRGPVRPCLRVNLESRKPWSAEDRMPRLSSESRCKRAFLYLRMQKRACYAGTWSTGDPWNLVSVGVAIS